MRFFVRIIFALMLQLIAIMVVRVDSSFAPHYSCVRRRQFVTAAPRPTTTCPLMMPSTSSSSSNQQQQQLKLKHNNNDQDDEKDEKSKKTSKTKDDDVDAMSSDDDDDNSVAMRTVLTSFLQSFWKGMSLPFPALRNIIVPRAYKAAKTGKEEEDSSTFTVGLSFREGLVALLSYLAAGVLAYSFLLEHWSIVDSLYFTCVCFSTVGYGDLLPSTRASKIFTCFFGMGGIAFLGAAIAAIGGRFVEAEMETVKTARRESRKRIMNLFEGRMQPKVLTRFRHNHSEEEQRKALLDKAHKAREELRKKFRGNLRHRIGPLYTPFDKIVQNIIIRLLPSFTIMLAGGFVMQRLNGRRWNVEDTIYYSLVTASTIGYGDLHPQTPAARLFAVFFIPLSVAAAGEVLSSVAMALVHRRQREIYEKQLESDLTIDHLKAMDFDKNGQISREEYVHFMLLEMGRVSRSELDELYTQFDRLDVTASGYLDNEDLALMAKLRGATVKETKQ